MICLFAFFVVTFQEANVVRSWTIIITSLCYMYNLLTENIF